MPYSHIRAQVPKQKSNISFVTNLATISNNALEPEIISETYSLRIHKHIILMQIQVLINNGC